MEKTIKEWLETLPEPYRTEALENADKEDLDSLEFDLAQAIKAAFLWEYSTQGQAYWYLVAYRAEAGEFNNSSLDKDTGK